MKGKKQTVFFQGILSLIRVVYVLIFGGRIIGKRVDIQDGAYILMCNHIHLLDCGAMAMAMKGREPSFMGKAELFKTKPGAWLFRKLHVIPVQRGQMDLQAMRSATQVLRDGQPLAIFPEGTRSRDGKLQAMLSGAALLALRSDAPVIPMYVTGRYSFRQHPRLVVGRPLRVQDLRECGADSQTAEELLDRLREAFESLAVRAKDGF